MPGTTYYLQPYVQSGDMWGVIDATYNYPGGTAIFNGNPNVNLDLQFSEGVIAVPEPSPAMMILFAILLVQILRRKQKETHH